MERKKQFILTLIIVLLVFLTIIIVTNLNNKENDKIKDNNPVTKKEKNDCVENICISKINIENKEKQSSIYVTLKNLSNEEKKSICLKLTIEDDTYPFCINNLNAKEEKGIVVENPNKINNAIKNYKLEKMTLEEKKTMDKK